MFGAGMVLTRGCSSRLLVLSANGNLRALLSGLVFAVAAQASLRGMASPLRDWLAGLWTIDGPGALNALSLAGLAPGWGLAIGLVWLVAGIAFAWRSRIAARHWAGAAGVGLMVALAWAFTSALAAASFAPQPVKSLSFTGPSANLLMLALTPPGGRLDFDIGLVPGVFIGSFVAAALGRELKLEGFRDGAGMRRYMAGAGDDGLWRHARRRLRHRRGRLGRGDLFAHCLGDAACHVDQRRRNGAAGRALMQGRAAGQACLQLSICRTTGTARAGASIGSRSAIADGLPKR